MAFFVLASKYPAEHLNLDCVTLKSYYDCEGNSQANDFNALIRLGGSNYGQDYWNRPGNHQLGGGRHGRRRAEGNPKRRRWSDYAFGRRLHQDGRATGGTSGEAAGHYESREHDFFDQALHGTP